MQAGEDFSRHTFMIVRLNTVFCQWNRITSDDHLYKELTRIRFPVTYQLMNLNSDLDDSPEEGFWKKLYIKSRTVFRLGSCHKARTNIQCWTNYQLTQILRIRTVWSAAMDAVGFGGAVNGVAARVISLLAGRCLLTSCQRLSSQDLQCRSRPTLRPRPTRTSQLFDKMQM